MSNTDAIVGLVGLVLVFAVLWFSAGPVVARTILSRRNGGRGGGFA
jgi:hypothetical protein